MAGELNTEVRDDAAGCRALAEWLRDAASGVEQVADALYRQRGESESFWQGTAGDSCRTELTWHAEDGDKLEQLTHDAERGLNEFAARIDAVRGRMDDARRTAREGGLIVTPTAILPPAPPNQAPAPSAGPGTQPAVDPAHEAQTHAFAAVSAMVADARQQQEEAHHDLDKAMQDPLATLKSLKTYTVYVVSNALNYLKTRQTMANDLFKDADRIADHGQRMQDIANDSTGPASTREAAERTAEKARKGADETGNLAKKTQPNHLPDWARRGIEANPGNHIPEGKGWIKLGRGFARGIPYLGAGVAVVSGGVDVGLGKDPGVATAETGANLAGGAAGGMAGAEVGTAIGTIFPGPGNVIGGVVGGIAGGVIGSMSAMEGVDQAMGEGE